MRTRWLAATLVVMSLTVLAGAESSAGASSAPSPRAHAACTHAIIVHKHKCIARGQFCIHSRRANHDYHRYGYHCGKRDRRGNYHLVYH